MRGGGGPESQLLPLSGKRETRGGGCGEVDKPRFAKGGVLACEAIDGSFRRMGGARRRLRRSEGAVCCWRSGLPRGVPCSKQ